MATSARDVSCNNNLSFSVIITLSEFILLSENITFLILQNFVLSIKYFLKQPFRVVLLESCSGNMQQIYRRTIMPKCDFNKVALELYWNRTSAWMVSCSFTSYFQNNFSQEHLWIAASVVHNYLLKVVSFVFFQNVCTKLTLFFVIKPTFSRFSIFAFHLWS